MNLCLCFGQRNWYNLLEQDVYRVTVSLNKLKEFCEKYLPEETNLLINNEEIPVKNWDTVIKVLKEDDHRDKKQKISIEYSQYKGSNTGNTKQVKGFKINNLYKEPAIYLDLDDQISIKAADEIKKIFMKLYLTKKPVLSRQLPKFSVS